MNAELCLFTEVPICAFRPYESREYQDTHPIPPPSSVYGMLLSLCGIAREDKGLHRGAAMVLAVQSIPGRSHVFRKLRRGRELGDLRPDYQDILVGLELWAWLADGNDQAAPSLLACVRSALTEPWAVSRSGGLSLGESSYLVNSVVAGREPPEELTFLKPDEAGFHSLPVWVDHRADTNIRRRFNLERLPVAEGLETCWFHIGEAS